MSDSDKTPNNVVQDESVLVEQKEPESDDRNSRFKKLRQALKEIVSRFQTSRVPIAPPNPKHDRTKALVLLIGGIVGSILLFLGVFSTPPSPRNSSNRDRNQPNLGRRDSSAEANRASATPLLNVQVQPDGNVPDHLSANDIHNTSRRTVQDDEQSLADSSLNVLKNPNEAARIQVVPRQVPTNRRTSIGELGYQNSIGTSEPKPVPLTTDMPKSTPNPTASDRNQSKSSIVFVRSANAGITLAAVVPRNETIFSETPLLSPGTRLIGRLESAVSSAIKTPVVVAVEYNYERNGGILIPAGTKVIGELQQASASGMVGIAFHSMEFPDGRSEPIEAIATDLRNEPLKGKVTGTNGSRRFLTRTLSGVGTVATYVIGGGAGLGKPLSGGVLLRDRVAGNLASAGEQEVTSAASSQNVVVTLPAQTRLSVVFQRPTVRTTRSKAAPISPSVSTKTAMPTTQELRELMELRQEINQLYAESGSSESLSKP